MSRSETLLQSKFTASLFGVIVRFPSLYFKLVFLTFIKLLSLRFPTFHLFWPNIHWTQFKWIKLPIQVCSLLVFDIVNSSVFDWPSSCSSESVKKMDKDSAFFGMAMGAIGLSPYPIFIYFNPLILVLCYSLPERASTHLGWQPLFYDANIYLLMCFTFSSWPADCR